MAIAQQTPLLLLDEPTSALGLGHQLEVFELIRALAMVVHDLVRELYGVECTLIEDPATGSPVLVDIRSSSRRD